MKKFLFISFLSFIIGGVLTSCTKEYKAKQLVKEDLKSSLKDPKSLDILKWGELDSSFTFFSETSEGKRLSDIESHYRYGGYLFEDYDFNKDTIIPIKEGLYIDNYKYSDERKHVERADSIKKIIEKKESQYKGDFRGWLLSIDYTAKNSFNANVRGHAIYIIDRDIKYIKEKYNY